MINNTYTLELRGISKQYTVSDKIITGINNVNIKFKDNEFVVVSGASGSGKSTLLNVIAGIDNYTDGYMVVKGYNTDFFGEDDWGDYRKNLIAYVHQNFYLIDNLTVYQNIETAYLLNNNKEKAKERIVSIINKVGLSKQINQKAKELSGGQKQRVAIARALAKNTGIILADEPTGNLDSITTKEIAQLLAEISKDNLVIVVSHNIEAFKEYSTRHIRIDNGRIIENKILKDRDINLELPQKNVITVNNNRFNKISFIYTLKSIINNNKKQFFSLFFIALIIMLLLTFTYGVIQNIMTIVSPDVNSSGVWRYVKDDRLIIRKFDTTEFSNDEINSISSLQEIDYLIPNDYPLDFAFSMEVKQFNQPLSINVYIRPIEMFNGIIDKGTYPSSENDVIVECFYDFIFDWNNESHRLINEQIPNTEMPINISGISNIYANGFFDYCYMYVSDKMFEKLYAMTMQYYTSLTYVSQQEDIDDLDATVLIDDSLVNGELMVSTGFTKEMGNEISFGLKVKNNDFVNKKDFTVKCIKDSPTDLEQVECLIYMNSEDYTSLYNTKSIHQMSLILKDPKNYDKVKNELISSGYSVYYPYSSLNLWQKDEVIMKFFIQLLMLVLSIAIVFASMLLLNNSIKKRIKSYFLLKSIGYKSSILSKVAILETVIPIVIAGIITFILQLTWNYIILILLKNSFSSSFSVVEISSLIYVCSLISTLYVLLISIKTTKGLKLSILHYLRGLNND